MGKSLTKKETAAEAKADGLVKPEAAKVEAEAKAEPEAKPGAAKVEAEAKAEPEAKPGAAKAKAEPEAKPGAAKVEAKAKPEPEAKPGAAKVEAKAKPEPEAKPGAAKAEGKKQGDDMELYMERLNRHVDELRWLYMELYDNGSMFAELCENMRSFYRARNEELKALDRSREQEPGWYKKNDMLGMMFYIDNFAGNMKGVEEKLDYLECDVERM